MPRLQSSRRVSALKESDYDHVIDLVDHDSPPPSLRPVSADGVTTATGASPRPRSPSLSTSSSKGKGVQTDNGHTAGAAGPADGPLEPEQNSRERAPSIEIQEATPGALPEASIRDSLSKLSSDGGPVIDLLYENERGGFLCGIPLFSSKALGNLDPTPWTNAFHKASPTDIHTAQVPDPTWEWAWPEWRVHQLDDTDEGGWEYSFMFSKKFSWHGPRWWNSFVRRRAWIRKRAKRRLGMTSSRSTDPHMLNADYFTVRPASEARSRSGTHGTSHAGSGASGASQMTESDAGFDAAKHRVDDVESLLHVLRRARIDREKAEAVGVYLEQGADLANLRPRMHDIMTLFVFQASRKMLLADLTQALDETLEALEKGAGPELRARREHLEGAVRCADEEVRRLAYWSDIKGMVEGGEAASAVARGAGWGGEWEGVDQSGPAVPRGGDEGKSQL